ncbi:hypothetical protein A3J20_05415 [Candidatus Gottesmanbacteria bacterium RIFCSPLOWO2_02_FULL_42_29]|uniref:SpoVT-AbrB domain-containing protein n=2 Tax=Candidatus Gottesmaniibacteriota TaxID=1752720 RepID=A0A1F6BJ06_9BACT|nr:MAG: hypothetical protein UV09_C0029G0006 [Candidatus Gottesmanbacteria bacterium GW2011_GWA2_42_18]KKS74405.1 MAG: hypothetical protein UV46_C0044G0005 [Candidatus Gottesmanbacteria bacterium GW2011_GWC2_42_8]OGG11139.1 MAG: hypothetical protein A2781_05125 [Candidatus Gottesmanbacteria bacterium RIFCSPHIGHO2_01_FULL_42_27]OGG33593.1 MAG: hypothetical protein A3G68_06165 [Candidatus Gottesmanbacteria bacterium RIFCSPLOWO2_12_FULL_42_10]OGG36915.1 MAG: hypothetical protein A2968_01925 [Candi
MIGYSVVNIKGQVTIPADIRKITGVEPQDRVAVLKEDDRIVIQPLPDIFSLMGSVKPKTKPEDLRKMRQKFIDYLSSRKKAVT